MKHLFPIYGMCSILWLGACTPVATQPEKSLFTTQEDFPNLLNVKNVPEQPVDGDLNLFSDLGAWSGYALPVNQSRAFAGAFIGPMTMHGRGWIAQTLAQPTLVVNGEKYDLVRNMQTAKYLPGKPSNPKDTVSGFPATWSWDEAFDNGRCLQSHGAVNNGLLRHQTRVDRLPWSVHLQTTSQRSPDSMS